VESGRYLCRIEKKMYRGVEKIFGYKVIVKGLNQHERGLLLSSYWDEFDEPICVSLDAKRFEQSVKSAALTWEHDRYRKYFPGDRYLRKLLRYQHINKGRARCSDGSVKFKLGPIRGSGDVNTALGNCMISAALGYSYLKHAGVSHHRLVLDGDDVALIISKKDLCKLNDLEVWYAGMGFRMAIEKPVNMLEHIDFCQSRPVWTEDGYVMVRNVLVALSKDTVALKDLSQAKTYQRWMAAVGKGGIALNGGIPIMQSFYQMYDKASNGAKPLPDVWNAYHMQNKFRGMKRSLMTIHHRTRHSFYNAFSILPEEQIAIECYYDKTPLSKSFSNLNKTEYVPLLPWGTTMPCTRAKVNLC